MTAKQKANQLRFKKVVAEASKLRKKNPELTQAQAVKKAWAMFKGTKVGATKTHKDTKSHNVNIRVVSGVKKKATKKVTKKVAKKKVTKKVAVKKQTGISVTKKDKLYQAMKPGKRTTTWGTTYYESRANRSDKGALLGIKGGVMGSPSYTDPDMAREIQLYADNDSQLYFSRKLPILKNLQKKFKKGTFDVLKSAKLWRYFIDDALQRYNKEFGSRGDKWYELMKPSDRQLLAMEYSIDTLNEFEMGNFIVD
jgi:hypothetical protein